MSQKAIQEAFAPHSGPNVSVSTRPSNVFLSFKKLRVFQIIFKKRQMKDRKE
jgi:hypothetical protein